MMKSIEVLVGIDTKKIKCLNGKNKEFEKILIREKIDGYFNTKNDDHFNEYISDQNDRLKYISNFSGSYGFALILKNKNFLFVDGRYSLQALNQSGKFLRFVLCLK